MSYDQWPKSLRNASRFMLFLHIDQWWCNTVVDDGLSQDQSVWANEVVVSSLLTFLWLGRPFMTI